MELILGQLSQTVIDFNDFDGLDGPADLDGEYYNSTIQCITVQSGSVIFGIIFPNSTGVAMTAYVSATATNWLRINETLASLTVDAHPAGPGTFSANDPLYRTIQELPNYAAPVPEEPGLSGGMIGGIAGGAVLITMIIVYVVLYARKTNVEKKKAIVAFGGWENFSAPLGNDAIGGNAALRLKAALAFGSPASKSELNPFRRSGAATGSPGYMDPEPTARWADFGEPDADFSTLGTPPVNAALLAQMYPKTTQLTTAQLQRLIAAMEDEDNDEEGMVTKVEFVEILERLHPDMFASALMTREYRDKVVFRTIDYACYLQTLHRAMCRAALCYPAL